LLEAFRDPLQHVQKMTLTEVAPGVLCSQSRRLPGIHRGALLPLCWEEEKDGEEWRSQIAEEERQHKGG